VAEIGKRASLRILREKPAGLYLDAGELGEILLPRREVPGHWVPGDELDVFLHHDSEDRLVATLREPLAMPGQCARLKCSAVTPVGAFLDWGLPKELFVPFREQKTRMEPGKSYTVFLFVDPESGRILATTRLARHLDQTPPPWRPGDAVDLIIFGKTPLGYKAVIGHTHTGLLYADGVFRELRPGERTTGIVTEVRPGGKIDLSLRAPGRAHVDDLAARILHELEARGGFWALSDDSPPALIREELDASKRAFKQATGALFRDGKVTLHPEGMRLVR
jgi:uncharacterized protein